MRGRQWIVWTLVSWFGSAALVASAQAPTSEPTDEDRAAARQAFTAGVAAARKGQWEEARVAFEEAYARVPQPSVLLNLAGAQRQTGQLVEAAQSYRAFLTAASDGPAAKHRDAAARALAEVEEQTPRVTVRAQGLAATDEVRIGGRNVSVYDLPGPFPVNPGDQAAEILRDGRAVASTPFSVQAGDSATVEIEAPPVVPSPEEAARAEMDRSSAAHRGEPSDRTPIVRSPWFWTGVGAAVVAGVATALVLSLRSSGPEPYEGNFPPGTVTVP
jgi:hypothetical protein